MRLGAVLLPLVLATSATGETPAEAAQAAAARLESAGQSLQGATGSEDRVAALTQTVHAYQEGLAAVRDGLRRAAIRERTLQRDLDARSDEVARLLGVLQTMGRSPAPLLLLHPSGPTGTARSGMMLADVTPALQAEVEVLRGQLEEIVVLRQLQSDALETLTEGLRGAQDARTALATAISDRTDLPRRFVDDPIKTALLIASTETLGAFATGLAEASPIEGVPAPDATALKGELVLPVDGEVLRRFRDADAAGIERPGILIATEPRALVTAPAAATIRYAGPLLDYGNVIILEPTTDVLWVLAGLSEVFGEAGQVLTAGAPVGLMGGDLPNAQAFLTESQGGASGIRSETLYLEVRDGQGAVDPGEWFVLE